MIFNEDGDQELPFDASKMTIDEMKQKGMEVTSEVELEHLKDGRIN